MIIVYENGQGLKVVVKFIFEFYLIYIKFYIIGAFACTYIHTTMKHDFLYNMLKKFPFLLALFISDMMLGSPPF